MGQLVWYPSFPPLFLILLLPPSSHIILGLFLGPVDGVEWSAALEKQTDVNLP